MFSSQPPSGYNLNVALGDNAGALCDDTAQQQQAQRMPATRPTGHHNNHHQHHQHLSIGSHNAPVGNQFPTSIHFQPAASTTIMTNQHQAHHNHHHHHHQHHRPMAHTNHQTAHSNNNSAGHHHHHQHSSLGQMTVAGGLQTAHFEPAPGQQQQQVQVQPQHLACVGVMNSDNLTNHLASAGHVIFNQSGLIRLGQHAGVLNASPSQAAIVVNSLTSEIRHQHQHQHQTSQQTIPTFAICDSNAAGNLTSATHYSNNCQNAATNINSSSRQAISTPTAPNGSNASNSSNAAAAAGAQSKSTRKRSRKGQAGRSQSGGGGGESASRRTFACPTCAKDFTEKFNMKRHMQVHSSARPKYICNECSKSFAWKDNFIRHKKAAHNNNARAIQTLAGHQ